MQQKFYTTVRFIFFIPFGWAAAAASRVTLIYLGSFVPTRFDVLAASAISGYICIHASIWAYPLKRKTIPCIIVITIWALLSLAEVLRYTLVGKYFIVFDAAFGLVGALFCAVETIKDEKRHIDYLEKIS